MTALKMTTERLIKLRSDARLERDTILEHLVRSGYDPAVAFEITPEVDDFVVAAIRDEMLEERGRLAEFGLARLAAREGGAGAAAQQRATEELEFELLREIAASVPALTVAVWRLSSKLNVAGPEAE